MIPETLQYQTSYEPGVEAHMWRRVKNKLMKLFAITPRSNTMADQLKRMRISHDEATRELVTLIQIGKPPVDWKPPPQKDDTEQDHREFQ